MVSTAKHPIALNLLRQCDDYQDDFIDLLTKFASGAASINDDDTERNIEQRSLRVAMHVFGCASKTMKYSYRVWNSASQLMNLWGNIDPIEWCKVAS